MENRKQDIPQTEQKIMNLKHLFFLFIVFLSLSCHEVVDTGSDDNTVTGRIDGYIKDLMVADEIPGLAIAVIQDSIVLHKGYYGYSNLENAVKVSDSAVFRLYSATKFMTAVAAFRLVQQKKINIRDTLSQYLDGIPEHWKQIQIKHLLTHSSGLPEYKDFNQSLSNTELLEKLSIQPLRFPMGERFEYNQTGFWLLQQIIEKVTKEAFEKVVLDIQFPNAGNEAFYASNSLAVYPNRNAKYIYDYQLKRYEHSTFEAGNRSLAGNGLNTTLDQLIAWNKLFDTGKLLDTETKAMFLTPFAYTKDEKRFLHGSIDEYSVNGHKMYGFSGGAVIDFKKFDTGLTIIILSNGFKYRPRIANMMSLIAGMADSRLREPNRIAQEQLRIDLLKSNNSKDFRKIYEVARKRNPQLSFEGVLNYTGYDFILADDLEKAIEVFQINIEKHPNSFNAYDSLGEAYMLNGNSTLAIENYKKSLELNPANDNAIQMIKRINNNK
ncbi:serine hydrolase domain-containing protein [Flagellimonas meridianipacifica]|uniref:CubicO group peptidase (Beta-lactamase class C family) n=1 Tax=Flagellimonas meridianipacifica TaxID=1080225 RepID=A0A2T0MAT7_9FLAO|nr:serine hydrolase domain-containing protein [Allomuricauda pacifica]PRX54624.1 CubicO group peptidase (beta-lactamase class C family) [Allomuricauda pacifica]